MNDNYQNPFDNDNHKFLVLKNARNQYSLWPNFIAVPAGWNCIFGPDERGSCVAYIDQHWTDLM